MFTAETLLATAPVNALSLVDTVRYPIHDGDSAVLRVVINDARAALAHEGSARIAGFIRPDARRRLTRESEELSHKALKSREEYTPYGGGADECFPEGHPRRRVHRTTSRSVTRDLIPMETGIQQLHCSPHMRHFIAACLNTDEIHQFSDPMRGLIINTMGQGNVLNWHFDANEFTVCLMTRRAEAGGQFEYCPNIRAPGDENFDTVRSVLDGKLDLMGVDLLREAQIELHDGFAVAHMARRIKTAEEVDAITQSVSVCQEAIRRMIAQTKPGMTENAIWSILHQTNIEFCGDWIETRLLTSGPRTNPWYQESSDRSVEAGDIVCLDSDMIGPHGYGADISRSWTVGDGHPGDDQRRLYNLAYEQVSRNIALFQPGRSFCEIAELAWRMPERYRAYEQPAIAHGSGLCNEFPLVVHADKVKAIGHDGIIEPGMVICVESYAGAPSEREGVKLEQQILVTDEGPKILSDMEFDEVLMN